MRRGVVLVLGALFVMSPAVALAQATSATDVTNAEVQAVRNHPEGGFDRQIKIVDVGDENIGLGILHREAQEEVQGPVNGFIHHDVTEVYYIVSGSGTLVTGGTLIDPRPFPSDSPAVTVLVGPSTMGSSATGHAREVSVGDTIIIPAGVFHAWKEIPDHVTYLDVRTDPDKVLETGYLHPALQ